MTTSPRYLSGIDIRAGDAVLYHGEQGTVEFVATAGDTEHAWYVEQFGAGAMVVAASFGRVFIDDPEHDEDLEFVGRGGS